MKKIFCTNCGEPSINGKFCGNCGESLVLSEKIPINESVTTKTEKAEGEGLKESVTFNIANNITPEKKELRSGSTGWIIFGFIFAVLGGVIGIAMGAHYAWWGKNYDENTRKNGKIMMGIGVVFFLIGRVLNS